jgi:RNA polymerase sigma factor (TIGR02999 family)
MRHEVAEHTLQPTALVHEAYLRLVDHMRVPWQNRAQFFGIAARCMRRVLVDHARARGAAKRGGPGIRASLDDASAAVKEEPAAIVVAVHEALERLSALDEEQARLVELSVSQVSMRRGRESALEFRYFAGALAGRESNRCNGAGV